MLRSEIIGQWRKMMNDEIGAGSNLWDTMDGDALFADACDALCEETRYFRGSMLDAICLINLAPGKRHYQLHPAVLSVEVVRPSWRGQKLDRLDMDYMDEYRPKWMQATGKADGYLLDFEPGWLTLSHEPAAAGGSIRLEVVRSQLDNTAETLEIPQQWHKYLKLYMAYQALFKQDSEVAGATRQADFKGMWDRGVEEMKREILRKRRSSVVMAG